MTTIVLNCSINVMSRIKKFKRHQGSNEVAPFCVGDFLLCLVAGSMTDGARVCGGPVARRRDRRLRQWLRHERLSIRMNVAEMRDHAAPQPTFIHVGTQTPAAT